MKRFQSAAVQPAEISRSSGSGVWLRISDVKYTPFRITGANKSVGADNFFSCPDRSMILESNGIQPVTR